ncbi:MAG TPA: FAD-linked oxidase C-terminal domain-containing protein [Gammaproteobacteria bacterium]|nr:FAD-linked oxidase C-terminal domain-containing protein [Gammaproteobacteria bacterium]
MNIVTQTPAQAVDAAALARDFRTFLPADAVLVDVEDLRPYECDGLSAYRELPMMVVLPDTVDQVRQILRILSEREIPVVARGAGTGLSGGALPLSNGVLLGLAKFNRILNIDPDNRCATVQPGVRNLAVSEAAAPYGLYYAPDPSSQVACSIGGNVAENSGGVHCLKYGLTVHNLLELKVVIIGGELLTIGSTALDSPGYDLLALMTGSEGMLGVIVEATVKLLPKPELAQVVMASFDKVEDAGNAVAEIIGAGIVPAGLEMMDNPAICAAEAFVHAGYPTEAAAILLCELDGTLPEVEEQVERVRDLLEAHHAAEVRIAKDPQEQARFWAGRKAAFPAVGRISPDYYCMDGTIPRKHLAFVLARMTELSEEYGLRVANVFHAGDGNLHPLILYDANIPDQLERAEAFGGKILELCVEVGGTITGEHGVGVEKINQMCVQFRSDEIAQFHAVKAAFDPKGLLNPGKAVPSLHRCAEFGRMHVHGGQLPRTDIPRF